MKYVRVAAIGLLSIVNAPWVCAETDYLNAGIVAKGDLPFSEAVQVENVLYLSGQVGIVPKTQKLIEGGIQTESLQAMENIKSVAEAYGYGMSDIVKCTIFLTDLKELKVFNDNYKSFFATGRYPARSAVEVRALALGSRVEVECMAAKS